MSSQAWWYVARASGYVAWGLLTASVDGGLLLASKVTKRRPRPAWLLDLHRFLAGGAVVFTGFHLAGLIADSYVHFGAADVLVPFASSWKPGPVALGVVSLYLLATIEVTSLLMRRLPRRLWKGIHLTSYALFWAATFHMVTAGRDASNPVARVVSLAAMLVVVFLTLVRTLVDRANPTKSAGVAAHAAANRVTFVEADRSRTVRPDRGRGGRSCTVAHRGRDRARSPRS
jgi:DMSO/TMAO reductase YedYZ heme-binding membrane subunit